MFTGSKLSLVEFGGIDKLLHTLKCVLLAKTR
jgi:hypothetical protein